MTLAEQIANLQSLSTAELAAEFERLLGRPPRYRSKPWLQKRIAFGLQVAAHGGLPAPARAELERLAADLHLPNAAPRRGDERGAQPKPGNVLQREWRGQQIRVHVTQAGFEWDGREFGSLSAVAKAITGQHWNGRLFFGLTQRGNA